MKGKIKCFSCFTETILLERVMRADECPNCRRDLHVCLNCRFYDKQSYHECTEPQAEYVQDKDRSNFCDYFEPKSSETKLSTFNSEKDHSLNQLAALFGGSATEESDSKSEKSTKSLADELSSFLASKKP